MDSTVLNLQILLPPHVSAVAPGLLGRERSFRATYSAAQSALGAQSRRSDLEKQPETLCSTGEFVSNI